MLTTTDVKLLAKDPKFDGENNTINGVGSDRETNKEDLEQILEPNWLDLNYWQNQAPEQVF